MGARGVVWSRDHEHQRRRPPSPRRHHRRRIRRDAVREVPPARRRRRHARRPAQLPPVPATPLPGRRRAWLNFAIIGAGPTGVELAGQLSEIANYTLRKDFRHIDPREAKIMLIEAAPRVLPAYTEKLSEKAKRSLERLRTIPMLNTM